MDCPQFIPVICRPVRTDIYTFHKTRKFDKSLSLTFLIIPKLSSPSPPPPLPPTHTRDSLRSLANRPRGFFFSFTFFSFSSSFSSFFFFFFPFLLFLTSLLPFLAELSVCKVIRVSLWVSLTAPIRKLRLVRKRRGACVSQKRTEPSIYSYGRLSHGIFFFFFLAQGKRN